MLNSFEIGEIEGDACISGMSGKCSVDLKVFAWNHGKHATVVEIVAMPSRVVFVENGASFSVYTDVVALRDTRGNTAPTNEGSDKHVVLVDGDLITYIDDKGIVVIPILKHDMAVIHMVGGDVKEVGIHACQVEAEAYAQIGKAHVGNVVDIVIPYKTCVEADDTTCRVL